MRDKYSLVIDYGSDLKEYDYKYFFENLIKNDKNVILPNYVYHNINVLNNITTDEGILKREELMKSIESCIKNSINEYIRRKRQEVRESIRLNENINLIKSYLLILKKFSYKLNTIKTFLKYDPSEDFYLSIFNKLFCDPIIHNVKKFSYDIMDTRKFKEVKFFIMSIKKISNNFFTSWLLPFIEKSIRESFNMEIDNNQISNNMIPIYQYTKYQKYYSCYWIHFRYLLHYKDIFESLSIIFVNNIISNISSLNSISDFNCFLIESNNSFNKIGKHLSKDMKEKIEVNIANNSISNINSDVSLDNICKFYITLSKYYSKTFPTICSLFCKKISQLIIQKNLYQELNSLLIENIKDDNLDLNLDDFNSSDSDLSKNEEKNNKSESNIKYLIEIIGLLTNKDIIYRSYQKFLMLRLLNYNISLDYLSCSIKLKSNIEYISCFENKLLLYLKKCFDNSQIYILSKCISDFVDSTNFNTSLKNPNQLRPIILSNNVWDLKILSNPTSCEHILSNTRSLENISDSLLYKLYVYSSSYDKGFEESRSLSWYLHIGKVEIRFNSEISSCILTLLPIQFLILEQIGGTDLTKDEILDLTFVNSYPINEIDSMLIIFQKSKLIIFEKDIYSINNYYDHGDLDLRSQYFNVSNIIKESIKREEEKICNDRVDITKCVINSILKHTDIAINNLFELCKNKIKVFELEEEVYDKAVNYMIEKDYIKVNGTLYDKLLY